MSHQIFSKALRWVLIVSLLSLPLMVSAADDGPQPAIRTQAILWSQSDNVGGNVAQSTNYPSLNYLDTQAADDFIVPAGSGGKWVIEQITVNGSYADATQSSTVNVYIYLDANGLPGAGVYTATNLAPTSGLATADFVISVAGQNWDLTPGTTYWLSVQANMPDSTAARWSWTERSLQSLKPSAWRDPAGLLSATCVNWNYRVDTCFQPPASTGKDLIFTIEGQNTIVGAAPLIFNTNPSTVQKSGGAVTINGSNFGGSSGAVVKLNGTALTTYNWVSDSVMNATLPTLNAAGAYSLTVSAGGKDSNTHLLLVDPIKLFMPLIRK